MKCVGTVGKNLAVALHEHNVADDERLHTAAEVDQVSGTQRARRLGYNLQNRQVRKR